MGFTTEELFAPIPNRPEERRQGQFLIRTDHEHAERARCASLQRRMREARIAARTEERLFRAS